MQNILPPMINLSKDTELLNKAVGAIHIKVQSGSLGLIQRKQINAFHYFARDNPDKETHYVRLQDLYRMVNYNSNNISEFKENARKLVSINVEWDYLREDNERVWGVSNILSEIEYVTNGIVSFSFPRRIREFLATQEHRALVNMQVQRQFTMSYALSLYENITIYRSQGITPQYAIEQLKCLLVVNDEENPTYKQFKFFNSKVIVPAIKEINEISDLFVEVNYHKKGRTVEYISFTIGVKPQSFLDFDDAPNITELHDRLVQFGCNSKQALDMIDKHETEYILGNLDYVESQLTRPGGNKIRNPMGLFIDALAKDYRTKEPEIIRKAREKREAEAKRKVEEEKRKLEEANEKAEQNRQIRERVKQKYNELDEEEKISLQELFVDEMINTTKVPTANTFKNSGLKSPLVANEFYKFLDRHWAK